MKLEGKDPLVVLIINQIMKIMHQNPNLDGPICQWTRLAFARSDYGQSISDSRGSISTLTHHSLSRGAAVDHLTAVGSQRDSDSDESCLYQDQLSKVMYNRILLTRIGALCTFFCVFFPIV